MADEMCYSDDTFGLKELCEQVNGGPGTAAVQPAVVGLGQLAPDFSGSSLRINSALRGTGATWQGQASTHAAGALGRVAEWADEGGQTAKAGGTHVQSYASSFEYLKAHVPKPEPVPALSTFDKVRDFVGLQTDHAAAIQRNQEAAAAAFQALAAHEQNTDHGITFGGQLGVTTRRGGTDHRGPWVVGFFRNGAGQYFVQLRRNDTVTIGPADAERLRRHWGELLDQSAAVPSR